MGEARRKKVDRGVYMGRAAVIEVFDPLSPKNRDDPTRVSAMIEGARRLRTRPTQLCGACDYEFSFGEIPTMLYIVKPFITSDQPFQFVSGFVCFSCSRNPDQISENVFINLRKGNPHIVLVDPGSA